MSYLALAKKIESELEPADDSFVGGDIVAVLIHSEVLEAEIWLALRADFQPEHGDSRAVFFADEISLLHGKTTATLRGIHTAKLAMRGGRVRQ